MYYNNNYYVFEINVMAEWLRIFGYTFNDKYNAKVILNDNRKWFNLNSLYTLIDFTFKALRK